MTGADDVVAVPETALRSALEFAVGIAAAGQKLRPALAYPAGLRPLLKTPRLDRAGLRAARRAIVADPTFRGRLAEVATDDLVDAVGIVWLRRPAGWEHQIVDLLAAAKAEAEAASAEALTRKADKRREAAEQAAARAHAEVLAHHELVAREQMRRARAEERLASTDAELTTLRRELARLEADLTSARARLETEQGRTRDAENVSAELTARLRDAEQMRDHVLAQRAVEAVAAAPSRESSLDGPRAAAALRQAAEATRDLAVALAAAGEALVQPTEPAVQPQPIRRRQQRSPIAIPGGIYGDSVAATMHVLRAANSVTIVDGYNVAKLAWPHLQLTDQRERCIELLEDLVRRTGAKVSVVFDGAEVVGAHTPRRNLVRVQYSPRGVTADDVIRSEVAAISVSTPVVVVTNDQAIVADMRAVGVNIVSSGALLAAAGRSPKSAPGPA